MRLLFDVDAHHDVLIVIAELFAEDIDAARACYSLKSFLIQSKVAARQRTPMKDLAVFS